LSDLVRERKLKLASAPSTAKARWKEASASSSLVVTFYIFDFCPKEENLVSKKKARSRRC